MYVYIRTAHAGRNDNDLWTVGFYDPSGQWRAESDHDSEEAAAERVHWLNGGQRSYLPCGAAVQA